MPADTDLVFDIDTMFPTPAELHPSSLRATGPLSPDRDDRRVADADNARAWHGGLSKARPAPPGSSPPIPADPRSGPAAIAASGAGASSRGRGRIDRPRPATDTAFGRTRQKADPTMQTLKIHTTVPADAPPFKRHRVYLINFPAAHTPGLSYANRQIEVGGLLNIVSGHGIAPRAVTDVHVISALGHQGAADAFAALLGCEVPVSRLEVTFEAGDIAVACKLRKRPQEGAILDAEAMHAIGFDLVRLDVSRLILPGEQISVCYSRAELLALGFSDKTLDAVSGTRPWDVGTAPLAGEALALWGRLRILWGSQFGEELAPTRETWPTGIDLAEVAEALMRGRPHRAEIFSVE